MGDLDREGANAKLQNYPIGTYLHLLIVFFTKKKGGVAWDDKELVFKIFCVITIFRF